MERAIALAGTGARVGMNYAAYYGKKALTGRDDREALDAKNADNVYDTFSKLKGGPLKVAQMLSIDRNLLPPAYAEQFAQAQYSAPPLSYPLVERTFRREFGKSPEDMFDSFTREAVSGASIGQVHRAEKDGQAFAVKVQYPGVAQSLKSDLAVVKPIALQIMGLRERDTAQFFREVEERLLEETDYDRELRVSMDLSEKSRHIDGLRFSRYYPEFSSGRVLTMDWMDGVPLDKFADSDAPQEVRNRIGQLLWDFYHHQIHELLVFHADPHPGNFLVHGDELVVLDFGCTKQLEEDFYRRHFRFMEPGLSDDLPRLMEALAALDIILPQDGAEERERIARLCATSIEMLARPFHHGEFDFGQPDYMDSLYDMGEANRKDGTLRGMRGERGSPHGIYVNRAYFGLYSLLVRLRARVRTGLPEWLKPDTEAQAVA